MAGLFAFAVPASAAQAAKLNIYSSTTGVYKGYVRYNEDKNLLCAYAETGQVIAKLLNHGYVDVDDNGNTYGETCRTINTYGYGWEGKVLELYGGWTSYDGANRGSVTGYVTG